MPKPGRRKDDLEEGLLSGARKLPRSFVTKRTRWWKMLGALVIVVLCGILVSTEGRASAFTPITPVFPIPESEQLNWGQYSPYFPLAKYRAPPEGCVIDQVNILQRHGARFPTSGATAGIVAALAKLQAVPSYEDPALQFLKTFKYDLGTNDLVPYGAEQSFDAGQLAFTRYSKLISEDNVPFVRADSSERVRVSAVNWTAGFVAANGNRFIPDPVLVLSSSGNDTLEDTCPNAPPADPQDDAWINTFAPPITAKLNAGAPGANLTNIDVYSLISLCPFETVAKQVKSDFCTLFESFPQAFPGFAYVGDLDKFYGAAYGNPLGRVQGVGWVNELLARLTDAPVRDHTQTNRTLDGDPRTFPLRRTLYADFSHDNQIASILAALGLFRQPRPLDPARPDPRRTFRASALVPFSGRVAVERLRCAAERRVRVLVQDVLQPLEFCGGDAHGMCTLDAFVESQAYARHDGEGDFERCFANRTVEA
ncbi:phytase [Phanerochaete sordida]|uniref:Phytase A n=1 Tax=Phanerochaete sordida TaxID=48140 RepID=A0A9P3G4G8_9APHY|nr:phytase [Phanerochaete sordida]